MNRKQSRILSACAAFLIAAAFMLAPFCPAIAAAAKRAEYEKEYGYMKQSGNKLGTSTDTPYKELSSYFCGDATLDGKLNTADAVYVLRYNVGIISFTPVQEKVADSNGDGRLNTGDAVHILSVVSGILVGNTLQLETYTITYEWGSAPDSGAVPPASVHEAGESVALPSNALTCAGFIFGGWLCSYDTTLYTPSAEFSMPRENVVFTAQWRDENAPAEHAVTVNYLDAVNDVLVGSETVYVTETTVFDKHNANPPEGYVLLRSGQDYTVTVNSSGVSPSSVTFNVYRYEKVDGQKYIFITTAAGLEYIRSEMADSYRLMNDIDLGGTLFTPIGWIDGDYKNFSGVFDGNGFEITGFNCDWWSKVNGELTEFVGLFASNIGIIKNLSVKTTNYDNNPRSYGVFGGRSVGIICGVNSGTIEDCHTRGCVGTSDSEQIDNSASPCGAAGGIVGSNTGTIYRCSAVVAIDAYFWAGGLVGKHFAAGVLQESWSGISANVNVSDEYLATTHMRYMGGLTGGTQGRITDCYAMVLDTMQANSCVGGITGWIKGGFLQNIFVAIVEGGLSGYTNVNLDSGYWIEVPEEQYGLWNFTDGVPEWPETFSHEVWDMLGAFHREFPNLTNNPRPGIIGVPKTDKIDN